MSTLNGSIRQLGTPGNKSFDKKYEFRAVLLLSIGAGLVGVDRFLIAPLFPTMMTELDLDYQDLGTITAALSIAWGLAALFVGRLSDRLGRRKVLIGSLVAFSILIGLGGLATGIGALIVIRALMGLADGAYTSSGIAATIEASAPTRHGLNSGLQQMALPLFGLAITPLLVTRLLEVVNWRVIFALLTIPGLLLAVAMYFVIRNQQDTMDRVEAPRIGWREVLGSHNLPILIIGMLCWLTCLIVTSALLPSYLIDHLGLSSLQMGTVMSAIGFGGAAGCLVLPAASDRLGRKPVMLAAALGGSLASYLLSRAGADISMLFLLLFCVHFFNFALIALTVGPISAESVPPTHMAAASGMVICVGELFGGGIAPIAAGAIALRFGIDHILLLATGALLVGALAMLFLRETAPRRLARLGVSQNA